MKIAIVGVGGVGGYFGGRLAESGVDMVFIARGNTLNRLKSEGLRIYSPNGNIVLPKINVTDHPDEAGKTDYIILGVKAWQVPEIAESLRPMIGENTAILPLQNGVEAAGQLVRVYGQKHVLGGMCRISAYRVSPNEIKHADVEPFIALGELNNKKTERVLKLVNILNNAKIESKIPTDINTSLWNKFLFIVPASGLGALTRSTVGEIRQIPETMNLLIQAMQEVYNLGIAKGIALSKDIIQKSVDFFENLAEDTTSSLQKDIVEGRPSELEYQVGAVARIGKELGIATPLNQFIYASLLPSEMKARKLLENFN